MVAQPGSCCLQPAVAARAAREARAVRAAPVLFTLGKSDVEEGAMHAGNGDWSHTVLRAK